MMRTFSSQEVGIEVSKFGISDNLHPVDHSLIHIFAEILSIYMKVIFLQGLGDLKDSCSCGISVLAN